MVWIILINKIPQLLKCQVFLWEKYKKLKRIVTFNKIQTYKMKAIKNKYAAKYHPQAEKQKLRYSPKIS